jgi:hypothetical protein
MALTSKATPRAGAASGEKCRVVEGQPVKETLGPVGDISAFILNSEKRLQGLHHDTRTQQSLVIADGADF